MQAEFPESELLKEPDCLQALSLPPLVGPERETDLPAFVPPGRQPRRPDQLTVLAGDRERVLSPRLYGRGPHRGHDDALDLLSGPRLETQVAGRFLIAVDAVQWRHVRLGQLAQHQQGASDHDWIHDRSAQSRLARQRCGGSPAVVFGLFLAGRHRTEDSHRSSNIFTIASMTGASGNGCTCPTVCQPQCRYACLAELSCRTRR